MDKHVRRIPKYRRDALQYRKRRMDMKGKVQAPVNGTPPVGMSKKFKCLICRHRWVSIEKYPPCESCGSRAVVTDK